MPARACWPWWDRRSRRCSRRWASATGALLGGDLTAALPGVFSPAAAASYLVFTALYAPCVAAQAAMRQELGSRLGTLAAAAGSCAAAWCAAAVVYRIAILI